MLQKEITVLPPTPLSDPAASFMLFAASTHIAVWKKQQQQQKKQKPRASALSHPRRGGAQILGWWQNLSL